MSRGASARRRIVHNRWSAGTRWSTSETQLNIDFLAVISSPGEDGGEQAVGLHHLGFRTRSRSPGVGDQVNKEPQSPTLRPPSNYCGTSLRLVGLEGILDGPVVGPITSEPVM